MAHRVALGGVFFLAAVLRVYQASLPITEEEAVAFVHVAHLSIWGVLSDPHLTMAHPLYAMALKASVATFGVGVWAIRLPALLAGLFVLPLFYSFVRASFNRHIALVALAFVAVDGNLVEGGVLARGYSFVWLFLFLALEDARRVLKNRDRAALWRVALWVALGMRVAPMMALPGSMVLLWVVMRTVSGFETSVRERLLALGTAFGVSLLAISVMHLPVLLIHGLEGVVNDPSYAGRGLRQLWANLGAEAWEPWIWLSRPMPMWWSVVIGVCVLQAVHVSDRYRALVLACAGSALLVTVVAGMVATPLAWAYCLFILHIATAVAMHYLFKAIGDRWPLLASGERRTGAIMCLGILVLAPFGMRCIHDRIPRYAEAAQAAQWLAIHPGPGDRVAVQEPWEAPLHFYMLAEGAGGATMLSAGGNGRVYLVVGKGTGQDLSTVLLHSRFRNLPEEAFQSVEDWRRLEIFATR